MYTEDPQLSRTSLGSKTRLGLLKYAVSWAEGLLNPKSFAQEIVIVGLRRLSPISHWNIPL